MDYFDRLTSDSPRRQSSQQTLADVNSQLGSQSAGMRNQVIGLSRDKKREEAQEDAASQENWGKVWKGARTVGGQMSVMAPDPTLKAVGFALQTVGTIGSAIQGIRQMRGD